MKNFLIALVIVLGIPLVAAAIGYFWYINQTNYAAPTELTVEIKTGDGLETISNSLKNAGVIESSLAFQIYSIVNNTNSLMQPGVYTIPAGSKFDGVSAIIAANNDFREVVITFPEGYTSDQIVNKLISELPLTAENMYAELAAEHWRERIDVDFGDNPKLEGFLFPDTYRFKYDSTPEEVISRFVDNFNNKWSSLPGKDNLVAVLDDYEIVKLASIIEKESFDQTERVFISEILQSKLEEQEYLAVNATLNYILDDPMAVFTSRETNYDSPFNSYKNKGLPPTPICNPSLESLTSVFEPQKNNYQYYLHDSTGAIHFASTYDEHLANVAKYIQ